MKFKSPNNINLQDLAGMLQFKVVPGDDEEADESRLALTWSLVSVSEDSTAIEVALKFEKPYEVS